MKYEMIISVSASSSPAFKFNISVKDKNSGSLCTIGVYKNSGDFKCSWGNNPGNPIMGLLLMNIGKLKLGFVANLSVDITEEVIKAFKFSNERIDEELKVVKTFKKSSSDTKGDASSADDTAQDLLFKNENE